ncbi:MAG: UDP-N-acetylglucosamine 1-carboxyvinyltransferase [Armatimonadota bacterium]
MEAIYIQGGTSLQGEITVSGSKNSSLAILAASLLAEGETILDNVPDIGDIHTMLDMLKHLGARVQWSNTHRLKIDTSRIVTSESTYESVRKMRASFNVLGPLVARLGSARVALPGGCDIGARNIDFHVRGLQALGAHVVVEHGYAEARAERLRGAHVFLDFPSVGATNQIVTTAVLAEGVTVIENAAEEPEVVDLANFLNRMGAKVYGAGTKRIEIVGVRHLQPTRYRVIPDRVEAATFAVAAAMTDGDVLIHRVVSEHVKPVLLKLRDTGADVTIETSQPRLLDTEFPDTVQTASLRVRGKGRPKAVDITATPHPGFPTDVHPPMAALLSVADGTAVITETVFERRFRYAAELQRMGADITVSGQTAVVRGVKRLTGAQVVAPDLRAGAALVLAGLVAEGETEITGLEHIDRGYECLVGKLKALGAEIVRWDRDNSQRLICSA